MHFKQLNNSRKSRQHNTPNIDKWNELTAFVFSSVDFCVTLQQIHVFYCIMYKCVCVWLHERRECDQITVMPIWYFVHVFNKMFWKYMIRFWYICLALEYFWYIFFLNSIGFSTKVLQRKNLFYLYIPKTKVIHLRQKQCRYNMFFRWVGLEKVRNETMLN